MFSQNFLSSKTCQALFPSSSWTGHWYLSVWLSVAFLHSFLSCPLNNFLVSPGLIGRWCLDFCLLVLFHIHITQSDAVYATGVDITTYVVFTSFPGTLVLLTFNIHIFNHSSGVSTAIIDMRLGADMLPSYYSPSWRGHVWTKHHHFWFE